MVCKQHYKNKAFQSGWLPDLTLKTDPIIVFLLYRSWLPQWKESNFLVSVYWQNRHTLKQISLTFDFRFLKKLPTRLINKKGYALHSSNQYPFTKRVSLLLLLICTLTVSVGQSRPWKPSWEKNHHLWVTLTTDQTQILFRVYKGETFDPLSLYIGKNLEEQTLFRERSSVWRERVVPGDWSIK